MFGLMSNLSDDQTALVGCAVALGASVLLMYLSYFLGPASRQARTEKFRDTLPMTSGSGRSETTKQTPVIPRDRAA